MVAVVSDAADPLARELDLWATVAAPVSPLVLAAALKALANRKVFTPERAELREAIVEADEKIRRGPRRTIECFAEAREKNVEFIARMKQVIKADEEYARDIEHRRQEKRARLAHHHVEPEF